MYVCTYIYIYMSVSFFGMLLMVVNVNNPGLQLTDILDGRSDKDFAFSYVVQHIL